MAVIEITQDELIEALASAGAAPTEARTVAELEASTGWPARKIRDAIGRLAMQDRIAVHQVKRPQINGTMRLVSAYAILPKRKTK